MSKTTANKTSSSQFLLSQESQETNKTEDFFNADGTSSQDYNFLEFNTQDDTTSELSQPSSQTSWQPDKINETSGTQGTTTQPSTVSDLPQTPDLHFNEDTFDGDHFENLQNLPEHACRCVIDIQK